MLRVLPAPVIRATCKQQLIRVGASSATAESLYVDTNRHSYADNFPTPSLRCRPSFGQRQKSERIKLTIDYLLSTACSWRLAGSCLLSLRTAVCKDNKRL
jgi:hypothetical protein